MIRRHITHSTGPKHTHAHTHTKPLGNTVSYSVNEQEAGSHKAQHAYTQEKNVCACVCLHAHLCVLTWYHASEWGCGVAALSSRRDMRRVPRQCGAGQLSTCSGSKNAYTFLLSKIHTFNPKLLASYLFIHVAVSYQLMTDCSETHRPVQHCKTSTASSAVLQLKYTFKKIMQHHPCVFHSSPLFSIHWHLFMSQLFLFSFPPPPPPFLSVTGWIGCKTALDYMTVCRPKSFLSVCAQ